MSHRLRRFVIFGTLTIAGAFALSACSSANSPNASTAAAASPTSAATCAAIQADPTLAPNSASFFPAVSDSDFTFGRDDAPVTLIEYCDFQSAGCKKMSLTVATLMQNRTDVRFVFRPFPLIGVAGMDKTENAMLAALAANQQGKFWTMYDLMFAKHDEWASLDPPQFNAWVIRTAKSTGLDADALQTAMNDPQTAADMMTRYEAVKKLAIPAVPLVLINGGLQPSYLLDYPNINDAVGLIALGRKQFSTCPPYTVNAAKGYQATILTRKGAIVIKLFPDKAPLAVNSFIFLSRVGWFDGVTFHRVIPGFLAQAGDPSGTGRGNSGYFFKNEISDLKFDRPGRVGMANTGPDTNGSQFFITFAPQPQLDGYFTIFGEVVSGLQVAEQLMARDPSLTLGLPPGDPIISVTIVEK